MIPFDAGAIGGKCRTNAKFYSIYYKQSDFGCQVFCAKVPGGAKGFKFVYANLLFWCAASRFAKPRSFLKKVLIVAGGSRGCGELIRGLQNLDAPCKGDVFTFFLRRAKRTKKHARGLRTSGLRGRFKALPEVTLQKFPAARAETGFACKTSAKRL